MGVCDVPVVQTVCEKVGEGAGAMISAPFEWLANGIAKTAAMLFEGVWVLLDSTTSIDVTSAGYLKVYNILFGIAVFVMLIFFCLQLLTGLVRRDPSALSRAALGLAKSVLGSFVVIGLVGTLLEVTDQVAIGIVHAAGTTMEKMGGRVGALATGLAGLNFAAPGVGAIVTIFLGSMAIAGVALVWFSLLIRKALLLVAIVLAPVALAGASWDATRGWISKWAAFVLALACSKVVVVVVFLVAVTQVSAPISFDLADLSEPIAGIVLMLIAGFAPYMCYKFIGFIGLDLYQLTESERVGRPHRRPPGAAGARRQVLAVGNGSVQSARSPLSW